mgnify:CR=1 FL=1
MSADSSANWWRPQGPVQARERDVPEKSGSGLSYWALIGFTIILLLAPQEQFAVLAPLRIALLSVAVAVLAYVVNQLSRRLPLLEFSPDVVLALLLTGWAILTIPFSYWPGGSVNFLTGNFLKAIICFLLLSHVITNFRQLWGISWCLVLCTIPLTLHTLRNYLAGTFMGGGERVQGYTSGLAQNPNDMALMLNLILPVCIALILGTRSSFLKLILGGIAMLIVVAVIATFSRAGFLTLVFIGICYAWLLRHRPQRVWIPIILIMGTFALPLVPTTYFERLGTIVNIEEDQTNSAQTRLADMKVALDVALSKPIVGSGIAMSLLALNEARGEEWLDVHNVYLQLAVDMGLMGLLLYLLLLFQCLRVAGRASKGRAGKPAEPRMVFLAEGLFVSLLAFALSAMFYPVAYNFYFFYFAGMAIAAGRIARGAAGMAQQ